MKRIKSYFVMKYEQLLMRLFDKLLDIIEHSGIYWYPFHVLLDKEVEKYQNKIWDLEDRLHEEHRKNDVLIHENMDLMERIDKLVDELDKLE